MKKFYPYLQDPYNNNLNEIINKNNYLAKINDAVNQKQHIKITLLDWDENPIKEIAGEVSSGSMTKDGTSSVRRTASLQINVDGGSYTSEDIDMDFSINKKIFVELGIENITDKYPDYPILWFPQGLFFIRSFSMSSSSTSSVTLSLSLRDKMSMLNGDVGGSLPASTIFDQVDTQLPNGEYQSKKVRIADIITELVNHFGGENLNNIVIDGVPQKIKRVVKWTGDSPLYLKQTMDDGFMSYLADTTPNKEWEKYPNNVDVGYVYDEFVYTGELEAAAGDTVCTVLDKLVQYLGNYEYYYDEYGIFHFREIKNYLNTTFSKEVINSVSLEHYFCETTVSKNQYTFNDSSNIVSISSSPLYENIKNDYIVEGLRKSTINDKSYPVRYHLAIDEKPKKALYKSKDGKTSLSYEPRKDFILYRDEDEGVIKGAFITVVENDTVDVRNFNLIYKYANGLFSKVDDTLKEEGIKANGDGNYYVYWDGSKNIYRDANVVEIYTEEKPYVPEDWRTELYVQGLYAKRLGTDTGYYFAELEAGWPGIYNLHTQQFNGEGEEDSSVTALSDGNYYLDFIDAASTRLGKYSVSAIGRRSDIVVDNDINCLFAPDIPQVVYVDMEADDMSEQIQELKILGDSYSQTKPAIYSALATGGYKNGAFDQIKYELYLHTNYQRSVSITAMPIYYLEPNTRVRIEENTTNTYGDFVIKTITIPFGPSASMMVSAAEAFERF